MDHAPIEYLSRKITAAIEAGFTVIGGQRDPNLVLIQDWDHSGPHDETREYLQAVVTGNDLVLYEGAGPLAEEAYALDGMPRRSWENRESRALAALIVDRMTRVSLLRLDPLSLHSRLGSLAQGNLRSVGELFTREGLRRDKDRRQRLRKSSKKLHDAMQVHVLKARDNALIEAVVAARTETTETIYLIAGKAHLERDTLLRLEERGLTFTLLQPPERPVTPATIIRRIVFTLNLRGDRAAKKQEWLEARQEQKDKSENP